VEAPRRGSSRQSTAKITRDDYGRPTIEAESEYDLFEAYGYAVAEDRLWQLELFRRSAKGRLAEVLGDLKTWVEVRGLVSVLDVDLEQRRDGYTEEEYEMMFESLPDFAKVEILAYRDGINRYLDEARIDTANKLPWEFHVLGYFPEPWSVTDSMAICRLATRIFGERGGRELRNLAVYQELMEHHGEEAAKAVFDDIRWVNDPDAPVTIPEGDPGMSQLSFDRPRMDAYSASGRLRFDYRLFPDVRRISSWLEQWQARRRRLFQILGLPTKFGSFGFVIDGSRSETGHPILFGGPQMGFIYPDIVHEVHLKGPGIHVTGMAFAGGPTVLIGHNERLAWTSTSAPGDNTDLYIEKLNPANPDQYFFQGEWRDMEIREERFGVRTSLIGYPLKTRTESATVRRTVHGPVIYRDTSSGIAITVKRAHWLKEADTWLGFMGVNRARNLREFEEAISRVPTSHNFLYADVDGNIGYWIAGRVPLRPIGYDPRLPLPGTGEAELVDGFRPMPKVINPQQGWLANWNNKPSVDFDNPDDNLLGKHHRVRAIMRILSSQGSFFTRRESQAALLSPKDCENLEKDIARLDDIGRKSEFLNDYLIKAIDEVGRGDPLLEQAKRILGEWDGYSYGDSIRSKTVEVGDTIFDACLNRILKNTFGDELGSSLLGEADLNTLLHVLDGPQSGVPPSRDYFNGKDWREVIVGSIREALEDLRVTYGPNMDSWQIQREQIEFIHVLGLKIGPPVPKSNRATYAQIVHLTDPPTGMNRLPSGQSAFIRSSRWFRKLPVLEERLYNQRSLFRNFLLKPMLFR